jgi:hypothetical protein
VEADRVRSTEALPKEYGEMGKEAMKEYRNMERSDAWTAENLKSAYAYANIST